MPSTDVLTSEPRRPRARAGPVALLSEALRDFGTALKMRPVWMALAAEDIGDAHRRTLLGPVWMLLNYLLYAGTFILLFGRVHGGAGYPAYVAVGLMVWHFISETISQSVGLFVREEGFIKGTVLPLSVYVLRQSAQATIRAGYALIGMAGILIFSHSSPALSWLWAIPGAALVVVTAPAAVILFAIGGIILPDTRYIVGNLMRLGMFLAPIFWYPSEAGGMRNQVYRWNPFTYYIELVRSPIVAGELPFTAWQVCIAASLLLWIIALLALGRYRKQLVFLY
ncbi:MAG: ABC transporter permease [Thermoanaerobaculia bacterium]